MRFSMLFLIQLNSYTMYHFNNCNLVSFSSKSIFLIILLFTRFSIFAQTQTNSYTNGVITAVPFLTIAPDARSGAMGEVGAATSPDANSMYWNGAKLAFMEKNTISLSYSPWLRRLLPNANLAYLNYASKLDERNAVGFALRYFNAGSSELYDENIIGQGSYQPVEFSVDGSLARKFGNNFSMSLTARYIFSRLGTSSPSQNNQVKPGHAVAADVGVYYREQTQQFGKDAVFSLGVNFSNMGTKLDYSINQKYFLPANLRIGAANTWYLDGYSQFTVAIDINKLMVPTPPVRDKEGNIILGKDDNRSAVSGIFGSFNDAPGGFSEELKEISMGSGVEYCYNNQIAFRAGYFYEDPSKGNRQYITLGTGLWFKAFQLDFSYLLANQQKSPLANTLRFSLGYKF
jgi:hypothetical protein